MGSLMLHPMIIEVQNAAAAIAARSGVVIGILMSINLLSRLYRGSVLNDKSPVIGSS